jgi:hypothetical protein
MLRSYLMLVSFPPFRGASVVYIAFEVIASNDSLVDATKRAFPLSATTREVGSSMVVRIPSRTISAVIYIFVYMNRAIQVFLEVFVDLL